MATFRIQHRAERDWMVHISLNWKELASITSFFGAMYQATQYHTAFSNLLN